MLSCKINVPTFGNEVTLEFTAASSVVFIGANGAGKTRLGVFLDTRFSMENTEVHRIPAHRSLHLNPDVIPPSLERATNLLLYGAPEGDSRGKRGHRFRNKPVTLMISDYENVMQALYAENNEISINYRQQSLTSNSEFLEPPLAKIDRVRNIWEAVLPHRKLVVQSGNIKTKTREGTEYSASEMSNGERVIFYLIAQAILAKPNSLLIFDEPEAHINKSILAKLWDEIESARSDCAFLYITHDVEFASSRHAAKKYALRNYRNQPTEAWEIEVIPDEDDIPDDVLATIIGSRNPILFIEGDGSSLDISLYRRLYTEFTVIPVGSCNTVMSTVASFSARPQLHRIGCAGLIDADGRTSVQTSYLEKKGIYCLPVSEVENLLLLPSVFLAVAKALHFEPRVAEERLAMLQTYVIDQAKRKSEDICRRYTTRQIDAEMKKIGLSGTDIDAIESNYNTAVSSIDVRVLFNDAMSKLSDAIATYDYERVLFHFDEKGLLAEMAKQLGYTQQSLEEFVGRALRSEESSELHSALRDAVPDITVLN